MRLILKSGGTSEAGRAPLAAPGPDRLRRSSLRLLNKAIPLLLMATAACQATPVQAAPALAQSLSRNTTYAAAARAVSLCYAVKMDWSPRLVAVWSRSFLQKHGVPQDMAWGASSTPQINALADFMYTRFDEKCNLKGAGVEL